MKPKEIEIPILTAGDYGTAGCWSVQTLKSVADNYRQDASTVPLVLGHPHHDEPAHGWVQSLRVSGKRLFAKITDLSDEVTQLVREGSYRKISAAFFPDLGGKGPSLKHVGLLGAATPRDRSLPSVSFMQDEKEATIVTFTDASPSRLSPTEIWPIRMLESFVRWLEESQKVSEEPQPEEPLEESDTEPNPESNTEEASPEEEPVVGNDAIDRFLDEAIEKGKLPPVFLTRGGTAFLRAIAQACKEIHFSEDTDGESNPQKEHPIRWFMETVGAFPTFFSGGTTETHPGRVETGEDRLYRRAFDRLDVRQDLKGRGVTMELFRKVYTPEDCRRILHHH